MDTLLHRYGYGGAVPRRGLVRRRGGALLVASRFAYGLRIAIPAACGGRGALRRERAARERSLDQALAWVAAERGQGQ